MEIKPCLVCGKSPTVETNGQTVMISCVDRTDDNTHFFSVVRKTRDAAIAIWDNLMTDHVVK